MNLRPFLGPLAVALTATVAPAQRPPADGLPGVGLRALARLDELPRLRHSIALGAVTSADPSGKNDDGFSGAHSFLRKEGDGLVIADLKGPGVVYRIWTPTPTGDPVEFYFDGETTPRLRLPMRALFLGGHDPFDRPLVGFGAGGYYSYVTLPYARSLRVIVRGPKVQFYQINYARYGADAGIATFDPSRPSPWREGAEAVLRASGGDLARFGSPPGAPIDRRAVDRTLQPGAPTTVFETRVGGRLVGLRLAPAGELLAEGRAALLRIYWDGATDPAVEVPVSDLFGGAWGGPAMAGLLAGATRDTAYLWFPMPFDRSARIEMEQAPGTAPRAIHAEIFLSPEARRPDEGRFYAVWRRENPTTPGQPFTFLRTGGRGHVVGVVLQAQGLATDGTPFFEGDDRVVIDGDTVVAGTGSEDSFNGGWYDVPGRWDARRSFPMSGSLGYSNPLARTGGYRFFLGDAYAYDGTIDFTIEHGEDVTNAVSADYAAVTYFYSAAPPEWHSTEYTERTRRASVPSRITLNPGWSSPVTFFSTRYATLTKRPEPGIGRYLSFVGDSTPDFGRHVLSLAVPVPLAGRYRVSILPVVGPDQGVVQLLVDDQPYGTPFDTSAPTHRAGALTPLGELDLDAGSQVVHFQISPARTGTRRAALDLIRVVLERVP